MSRRADEKDFILSTEQVNPVPAPLGLDLVVKKDNEKGKGTRRKHSIVLEERTKVLKAAAHEHRPGGDIKPKKESNLNACCMQAPTKQIAKKSCQCLEDVDCEHMNFQVSLMITSSGTGVGTGLEKNLKSSLPFAIELKCGLSGALLSGQFSKKSCLPGREIYLPRTTGQGFFLALRKYQFSDIVSCHENLYVNCNVFLQSLGVS